MVGNIDRDAAFQFLETYSGLSMTIERIEVLEHEPSHAETGLAATIAFLFK